MKLSRAGEVFATLAETAAAEGWSHVEYLAAVAAAEAAATRDRRLAARLRFAHLPARRHLEDFDFDFQPSIDRKLIHDLPSCRFVGEGRPIVFLGQPGCGKSHLASALCAAAVTAGYRGFFTTAADLVANIAAAYSEGTFATRIRAYTGPSVLVIDDVGLVGYDRHQANALCSRGAALESCRRTRRSWRHPSVAHGDRQGRRSESQQSEVMGVRACDGLLDVGLGARPRG